MHSTGSISQRAHEHDPPGERGVRASAGRASSSVETRWLGRRRRGARTRTRVIAVSTRPLSGTGSAMTTSKAREPVGRHHQQAPVAGVVEVADLAARDDVPGVQRRCRAFVTALESVEDRAGVAQGPLEGEGLVERVRPERDPLVLLEQGPERDALVPRPHGVAPARCGTRHRGQPPGHEGQQDGLGEDQAVARPQVGQHPLGVHLQPVEQRSAVRRT